MDNTKDKAPGYSEHDRDTGDDQLVQQFKRGDDTAFDRIVEKYSPEVCLLANRLLSWPGDVEDVAQDIFVSALLGLKRFEGKSSLRTWLFRITINKCRSYGSRGNLWSKYVSFRAKNIQSSCEVLPADQKLERDEASSEVRTAVESLEGKYREAVVLKYLHELDTEKI